MVSRYALAALVALAACSGDPEPRPAPTTSSPTPARAAPCGPVTPRTTSPEGAAHVRLGPVALFASTPPGGPLYVEDYALTRRVEVLERGSDVELAGRHCESGAPLRFWAGRGNLPSAPPGRVPSGETRMRAVAGVAYFLFDATGRWEISATRDGRVVGTAVVEVASRAGTPSG